MAGLADSTPAPDFHPVTGVPALHPGALTMSSREIAELTGSTHDNVLKTVRALIERGVVFGNETPYVHPQNGQTYTEFELDYRNTMVVVSGYSAEMRARIIDRWMELEEGLAARPVVDTPPVPAALPSPRAAVSTFKAYAAVGKLIGLDRNQMILAANRATRKTTGIDLLADMEVPHLLAPHQETLMTVTELGMKLGGQSAQTVNKALTRHGFQVATRDPKGDIHYEATDLGGPYSRMLDVDKAQGSGAPVLQLRWLTSVVGPLSEAMGGATL